jgi:hypothetical protein
VKAAELLSKSEYARRRGCAPSAVTKAIKEGRISLIGDKINPRLADLEWAENTRARADSGARAPRSPVEASGMAQAVAPIAEAPPALPAADGEAPAAAAQGESGYHEHRRRREAAEAERAELETARMAGRLVELERAERGTFEAFRELRDAAFAAIKSQARRIHGLTEVREIEVALEDELRGVFSGWEERMQQRLAEARAT